ncbi:hypothetical protein M406DRAFT_356273 [Cryphonectria parasitica EP155]|uniref:Uncharacterized protein n=1 Tax=Cryphonectria parasitica (strain ATCC 38755 / EP155) TaxID=660469 RepID=A0A9P5CPL6_CRYP1|nr:uncharacterized protein M406DRAFT_356273 [Cryphonectria parasitica EP155]KAF3766293.1 hypothetical protein M406DRAFT_356273 [Cryphonectria parasitica EP155]
MAFGIRASNHPSQYATTERPPVCPCARCFHGDSEERALREACRAPAKELSDIIIVPVGHRLRLSNPFAGLAAGSGRFGHALGKRRSIDTVASDMRPLTKIE